MDALTQVLVNQGVAGAMLLWFIVVVWPEIRRFRRVVDRQNRAMMLLCLSITPSGAAGGQIHAMAKALIAEVADEEKNGKEH